MQSLLYSFLSHSPPSHPRSSETKFTLLELLLPASSNL